MERAEHGVTVHIATPGDEDVRVEADRVLVSVGIEPNTEGLDLERAGVGLTNGFIKVDERLSANGDGVYAVGDVIGTLPLAHVAQAQGVYVAERLAGEEPRPLDYRSVPRAIYCNPQVASMGLSEQEGARRGLRGEGRAVPAPSEWQSGWPWARMMASARSSWTARADRSSERI